MSAMPERKLMSWDGGLKETSLLLQQHKLYNNFMAGGGWCLRYFSTEDSTGVHGHSMNEILH